MNIIRFWIDLWFKPMLFFKKNLRNAIREPRYKYPALVILCIGCGIDRMNAFLLKSNELDTLGPNSILNFWPVYWIGTLVSGLIAGYLLYLIGAWLVSLRVRWSGGIISYRQAKHIFLYTDFLKRLTAILLTIVSMLVNPHPFDSNNQNSFLSLTYVSILAVCTLYSMYLTFKGVNALTGVQKGRSIVWFMIIPMSLYAAIAFFMAIVE